MVHYTVLAYIEAMYAGTTHICAKFEHADILSQLYRASLGVAIITFVVIFSVIIIRYCYKRHQRPARRVGYESLS